MTEDSSVKDDDYLVRVKAQVMTRDDSSGGWVPMGGGGMSIVGLRKLVISHGDDIKHEYLIHGERMGDQSVVLNCVLRKDVQYTKVNPTFHHWRTEEKRFGLTFQSSADARAFDKGVKRAVDDLQEGSPESNEFEVGDDDVFMTLELPFVPRNDSSSQSASTASTTTSSPSPQSPVLSTGVHPDPFCPPTGVGMGGGGGGGSGGGGGGPPPPPPPHPFNHANCHHHLHRVHYISRPPVAPQTSPPSSGKSSTKSKSGSVLSGEPGVVGVGGREEVWVKAGETRGSGKSLTSSLTDSKIKSDQGSSTTTDDNIEIVQDYSYVQFARNQPSVHDYSYPNLDSIGGKPLSASPQSSSQLATATNTTATTPSGGGGGRDSLGSLKKHCVELGTLQPPLPTKSKKKKKERKRDKRQSRHLLSRRARCIYCHEMFLQEENLRGTCDNAPDRAAECIEKVSCICCAHGVLYHCMADADGDYGHPCVCDTADESNCKRWTALTILSFLVPCLWCYWPLTACHRCGVSGNCCGGRHKAA